MLSVLYNPVWNRKQTWITLYRCLNPLWLHLDGSVFFVVAWFYIFCLYAIRWTHQFEHLYVFLLYPISLPVADFADSFLMYFEYYLCNSIYFLGIWLHTSQAFLLKKYQSIFTFWFFYYTLAFLFGTGGFNWVSETSTLPSNTKSNVPLETKLRLLIRLCAFWRDSFQSFQCFVLSPPPPNLHEGVGCWLVAH